MATPRHGGATSRRAVGDVDVEALQRGDDVPHDGVLVGQREPADVQHVVGVRGWQDDEGYLVELEEGLDDRLALWAHLDIRGDVRALHEHDASRIIGPAVVHGPAERDRRDRDRRLILHDGDVHLAWLAVVGGGGPGPKALCGHYDHALL